MDLIDLIHDLQGGLIYLFLGRLIIGAAAVYIQQGTLTLDCDFRMVMFNNCQAVFYG